jgi:hypothetical protein
VGARIVRFQEVRINVVAESGITTVEKKAVELSAV